MTGPTQNRRDRTIRSTRRGVASGALLAGLVAAVGVVAITVNVARVQQVHDQLRIACEAAALAGAAELLDEHTLYGVADQQGDILAARLAAQQIASRHLVDAQPLVLDLNLENHPAGDIAVGCVNNPGAVNEPLWHDNGLGKCNSVLVNAARHQRQGNPVALWMGSFFGVATADVSCSARASLDDRVVGFRPQGLTASPVAPLLVDAESWHAQRKGTITPWNDRFTVHHASGAAVDGPDGLIELEFRCPLDSRNPATQAVGTAASGRCALLVAGGNHADTRILHRQCEVGLTLDDLQPLGGELVVPFGGELNVTALEYAEQTHCDSLWSIRGQRRVWSLCKPLEQAHQGGRWSIVEFAAGVVVDSYIDSSTQPGQLVVCVQPALLATSTAVVDPNAAEHPSIAKLLLTP